MEPSDAGVSIDARLDASSADALRTSRVTGETGGMDLGATRRIRRAVAVAIVGAVLASACACAPESAQPTVAPSAS